MCVCVSLYCEYIYIYIIHIVSGDTYCVACADYIWNMCIHADKARINRYDACSMLICYATSHCHFFIMQQPISQWCPKQGQISVRSGSWVLNMRVQMTSSTWFHQFETLGFMIAMYGNVYHHVHSYPTFCSHHSPIILNPSGFKQVICSAPESPAIKTCIGKCLRSEMTRVVHEEQWYSIRTKSMAVFLSETLQKLEYHRGKT